jgi:hypothetical protein
MESWLSAARMHAPFLIGITRALAWSPDCSRIASVGNRVRLVDTSTGATCDLGPLPAGFTRVRKLDDSQSSIAWSPSGRCFAVAFGTDMRDHDGVVLFGTGGEGGQEFALPRGELLTFSLLDDVSLLASLRPGGTTAPVSGYHATTREAVRNDPATQSDHPCRIRPDISG